MKKEVIRPYVGSQILALVDPCSEDKPQPMRMMIPLPSGTRYVPGDLELPHDFIEVHDKIRPFELLEFLGVFQLCDVRFRKLIKFISFGTDRIHFHFIEFRLQ